MTTPYIQNQLARLRDGDLIAIKLSSMANADSTNFINLSPTQLEKIKAILLEEQGL